MQQKLMKNTAICSVLFAIAAMAVILYVASIKVVEIADVAQDEVDSRAKHEDAVSEEAKEESLLTFSDSVPNTNYLCIPLKEGSSAESVTIENHYMDKELWIIFSDDCTDFYKENKITGNQEKIKSGSYDKNNRKTQLKFSLTGIYEYRSILEENNLYIEFVPPKEMYDKIVVIDPAGGKDVFGSTANNLAEKNVTLKIAQKLKTKLDATDIKVYYTRMDDAYPKEESRYSIANETKADMLIRIQVDEDKDSKIYGTSTIYNENFFVPGFGNVELADLLEREVVTSISGKAIGLFASEDTDIVLESATVPAAAINVGYITNAQEEILLEKDDYLDKIASGIYNAIIKAYDMRN